MERRCISNRKESFKKINGKKVTMGPTLYYLLNGPKRSFIRQELQVVPEDTDLNELLLGYTRDALHQCSVFSDKKGTKEPVHSRDGGRYTKACSES